jgi:hypothetical protein
VLLPFQNLIFKLEQSAWSAATHYIVVRIRRWVVTVNLAISHSASTCSFPRLLLIKTTFPPGKWFYLSTLIKGFSGR